MLRNSIIMRISVLVTIMTIVFSFIPPADQVKATSHQQMIWQTVTFEGKTYQIWLVLNPFEAAPPAGVPLSEANHGRSINHIYVTRDGNRVNNPALEMEIMFLAQNNLRLKDFTFYREWATRLSSIDDGELVTINDSGNTFSLYIPIGLNPNNGTKTNVINAISNHSVRVQLYKELFYQMIFPTLKDANVAEVEGIFDNDLGPLYSAAVEYANSGVGGIVSTVDNRVLYLDLLVRYIDMQIIDTINQYTQAELVVPSKLNLLHSQLSALGGILRQAQVVSAIARLTDVEFKSLSRFTIMLMYINARGADRLEALEWLVQHSSNTDPAVSEALLALKSDLSNLYSDLIWSLFFKTIIIKYSENPVSTFLDILSIVGGVVWASVLPFPASVIVATIWTTSIAMIDFGVWVSDSPKIIAQAGLALTIEHLMTNTLLANYEADIVELSQVRNRLMLINMRLHSGYLFYRTLAKRLTTNAQDWFQWFLPELAPQDLQNKLYFRYSDYIFTLPLGYLETLNLWMGRKTRGPAIIQISPDAGKEYESGSIVPVLIVNAQVNNLIKKVECKILDTTFQQIGLLVDNSSANGWRCDWNTSGMPIGDYLIQITVTDDAGNFVIEDIDIKLVDSPVILTNPTVMPANSGDISTNFQFAVTYTNPNNIAPDLIKLIVDGTEYSLSSSDNIYNDGAIYTSANLRFATGSHSYYFRAVRGMQNVQTTPLNFYVYLPVTGHNLTLTTLNLDKTIAQQEQSVVITGQVNNNGSYVENNITIETRVTGPGSYSWSYTKNIGTLETIGGTYIWSGAIATWQIPNDAPDGEYFVQVVVNSPAGDENWSDNTQTRNVYVSDAPPLRTMTYRYQFKQLNFTWNPPLPAPFNNWGAYGPGEVTNPRNGKKYQLWVTDTGVNEWSFYIKDTAGNIYRDFYASAVLAREVDYEDNFELLFSAPSVVVTESYVWIKMGYPETNATITPGIQPAPVGTQVNYLINVPCGSSCGYINNYVYKASNGDDPPYEFFHTTWAGSYSVSGSGPSFTLRLAPYQTGVQSFAFDTRKQDLTSQNYIVYARVEGYQPIDNPPAVQIDIPLENQIIYGTVLFSATSTDDKGITKVEFYVDGTLKTTDVSVPYTYNWMTTTVGDGAHTLMAKAYDTSGQSVSKSIIVTVDNNPPTISGVGHSPMSPTNLNLVTVQASLTDVSGISVALLKYSRDNGQTWNNVIMTNIAGSIWQATVPAFDMGEVVYKLEVTDLLGRLAASNQLSYQVSDISAPVFYNWIQMPSNVTEDTSGSVRVTVNVADVGGSGLGNTLPGFDYRIGNNHYDGYEMMTFAGQGVWYFDIPSRDLNALRGQTLYYKVQAADNVGNIATSIEMSELINSINDAPRINSALPSALEITITPQDCQQFSVTATDEDGDVLYYSWLLDGNSAQGEQSYTYCAPINDNGNHVVMAVVGDGQLQASRSWIVNISSPNAPEIDVIGNNASIPDGSANTSIINHTDFGEVDVSSGTLSRTFTIYNTGTANLTLNGNPKVSISGIHAADFTVSAQPADTIAPGASSSFTITFNPSGVGARQAIISIANNDANENPYDFAIQGTGTTRQSCDTPLFLDDFSANKGWIDQSNGYVTRDAANQWLSWNAARSYPMRYYIPITPSSGRTELSFRFKVTGASGNGGVYFGLVENLDAPANIWGIDATGAFVGINRDTAYGTKIAFASLYSDGTFDGVDNQFSAINYGGLNVWRKATLTIENGNWSIVVVDDAGNPVGQMSGVLSGRHLAYNYVMLAFEVPTGWENETGYLDDVEMKNCFISQDTERPAVVSIVRASANPTNASNVNFTVTFSEDVTDVGADDFSLFFVGSLVGANITEVSGSGDTYMVRASTGAGGGSLRLDIPNTAYITDLAGNPLANLPYENGESYAVNRDAPLLLDPENTTTIPSLQPFLDWSETINAVSYQVQIARSVDFKIGLISRNTATSQYLFPANLIPNTIYYWRVRSRVGRVYAPWSEVWSFTTPNPPSTPLLRAPSRNALLKSPPVFDWSDSFVPEGVTFDRYEIQVSTHAAFTSLVVVDYIVSDVTESQYTPSVSLPPARYYWRVRAWSVDGHYSLWSAVGSFRIR